MQDRKRNGPRLTVLWRKQDPLHELEQQDTTVPPPGLVAPSVAAVTGRDESAATVGLCVVAGRESRARSSWYLLYTCCLVAGGNDLYGLGTGVAFYLVPVSWSQRGTEG